MTSLIDMDVKGIGEADAQTANLLIQEGWKVIAWEKLKDKDGNEKIVYIMALIEAHEAPQQSQQPAPQKSSFAWKPSSNPRVELAYIADQQGNTYPEAQDILNKIEEGGGQHREGGYLYKISNDGKKIMRIRVG